MPKRFLWFLSPGRAAVLGLTLTLLSRPAAALDSSKVALNIILTSPAFGPGMDIPMQYSCNGDNISPPLEWTLPPVATRSLVLICEDPDAPSGSWVHWLVINIDSSLKGLPEGVSLIREVPKAAAGRTDFRLAEYGGPCPPAGLKHRYYFRLYALDIKLKLREGCLKSEVMKAMEGHALGRGELMGKFGR